MQSRVKPRPGVEAPTEKERPRSPFTVEHEPESRRERAEALLAFIDEQIGKVNQPDPFAAEREGKIERGELQTRGVKVPKRRNFAGKIEELQERLEYRRVDIALGPRARNLPDEYGDREGRLGSVGGNRGRRGGMAPAEERQNGEVAGRAQKEGERREIAMQEQAGPEYWEGQGNLQTMLPKKKREGEV